MKLDRSKLYSAVIPHDPVDLFFDEPSRTRQEFADDADINVLMARFEKSGIWPLPEVGAPPVYFDTTLFTTDFQSAMHMMAEADTQFMRLPAVVRREFDNDPSKFVSYALDPKNIDRMREWGLAPAAPAPEPPMRVQVVPDPLAPPAVSPAAGGAPTQ